MTDIPKLKSSLNEYEEYLNLKESIQFYSNQFLIYYLNDIYDELFYRLPKEIINEDKISIIPNGLTEIIFSQYCNFQDFICVKLFRAFTKKDEEFLSKQDFINGIFSLYLGTFQESAEVIFSLYDFNKNGKIYKDNIKLLLSYIPTNENEYKKQIKLLKELDKILDETFTKGKDEMSFEEFLSSIQNKNGEIFLRIIIYFYKNKPFEIETVNSYKYMRKKPMLKSQIKIQSKILLLSANKIFQNNFQDKKLFKTIQKNKINEEENTLTNKINRNMNRRSSAKNLPSPVELFKIKKNSSSTTNIFYKKNSLPSKNFLRKNSVSKINKIEYKTIDKLKGKNNMLLNNNLKKRKSIGESLSNSNKGSYSSLPLLNNSKSGLSLNNSRTNRTKYKLSPISKKNSKFSPQSVNNGNFENECEDPPEFCLYDDDNNDINDFKLDIQDDDKIDNNDINDDNNDISNNDNIDISNNENDNEKEFEFELNNERKNNLRKKLDSFKKFKATLSKFNNVIEDYLFKFDDSKIQILRRYYCVLNGNDLLFFSSNLKNEFISIMNIKGSFIKKGENLLVAKETYYTIIITFSNNKKRNLYFLSDITRDKWIKKLKDQIKNYDFNNFYILKEQIGEGYFGKVQKGIKKENQKEFAVKVINKLKLSVKNYKLIYHEVNIMKLLNHPHIVHLEDYFEDDEYIYIIMEYLSGGDLLEFIEEKENFLTEKISAKIIKEIARGIKYMNLFGLIHRDLKPENIVFAKKDDITSLKIIDFGLTKTLGNDEKAKEAIGTITYLAPEVFLHKPYNHKVDIWSIGIILYYLLSGLLPFDDEKLDQDIIGKKVVFSNHEYPKDVFGNISNSCLRLIDKCLEKNPDKRISINEFLKNEWVCRESQ